MISLYTWLGISIYINKQTYTLSENTHTILVILPIYSSYIVTFFANKSFI